MLDLGQTDLATVEDPDIGFLASGLVCRVRIAAALDAEQLLLGLRR